LHRATSAKDNGKKRMSLRSSSSTTTTKGTKSAHLLHHHLVFILSFENFDVSCFPVDRRYLLAPVENCVPEIGNSKIRWDINAPVDEFSSRRLNAEEDLLRLVKRKWVSNNATPRFVSFSCGRELTKFAAGCDVCGVAGLSTCGGLEGGESESGLPKTLKHFASDKWHQGPAVAMLPRLPNKGGLQY